MTLISHSTLCWYRRSPRTQHKWHKIHKTFIVKYGSKQNVNDNSICDCDQFWFVCVICVYREVGPFTFRLLSLTRFLSHALNLPSKLSFSYFCPTFFYRFHMLTLKHSLMLYSLDSIENPCNLFTKHLHWPLKSCTLNILIIWDG